LNKEGDIYYIIQNIRIMRYFLKTVLDKDQRVLLKLKSRELIESAEEDDRTEFEVKKLNKAKLIERYVDIL